MPKILKWRHFIDVDQSEAKCNMVEAAKGQKQSEFGEKSLFKLAFKNKMGGL